MIVMFKTVRISGREFLLRSHDGGKNWFCAPRDVINTRRRIAKRLELLKRQWRDEEIKDEWTYGIPENCFPVTARV